MNGQADQGLASNVRHNWSRHTQKGVADHAEYEGSANVTVYRSDFEHYIR